MNKETFFTYHQGYNKRITAYYAGNIVTYTLKQFLRLKDVILSISGEDYKVSRDTCIKL